MIAPEAGLSISRQCTLLGIARHPVSWFINKTAVFTEVIGLTKDDLRSPVIMGQLDPGWVSGLCTKIR